MYFDHLGLPVREVYWEPPLSCRFTGGYLLPYRFLFTFVRAVIADSFRDEPLSTLTMRFRLDTCTFPFATYCC